MSVVYGRNRQPRVAQSVRFFRPSVEHLEARHLPGETLFLGWWGLTLLEGAGTRSVELGGATSARMQAVNHEEDIVIVSHPASTGAASTVPLERDAPVANMIATAGTTPHIGIADLLLDDVPKPRAPLPHHEAVTSAMARDLAFGNAAVSMAPATSENPSASSGPATTSPAPEPVRAIPPIIALAPDSAGFDPFSGEIAIRGDSTDNAVQESVTTTGFMEVSIDGHIHSSDPAAASFDPMLAGATATNVAGLDFIADGGQDTLTLGSQHGAGDFSVRAPGATVLTQEVAFGRQLTIQASDITVRGALHGSAIGLFADDWVSIEATASVTAGGGAFGGIIEANADHFVNAGQIHADGSAGGAIGIQARNILNAGPITADALGAGEGGAVQVNFTGAYEGTVAGTTTANADSGHGGHVVVNGGTTGRLYTSGRHAATGSVGGAVDLLGHDIVLNGPTVDVSGATGAGSIRVGGDFHGRNPNVPDAESVTVTPATTIQANAEVAGNGGRVAIWSDSSTEFQGSVSVHAGAAGAGGFIEVSSKANLDYAGSANAGSSHGRDGTLLLDPKNLIISAAPVGVFPQFDLIDPHPTAGGSFGTAVNVLTNGNIVVTNPNDNFSANDSGAAYLFDGSSGALISALLGGGGDRIGSDQYGVTALSTGNFLVVSPLWHAIGAVTWGNGTRGISGLVSAQNSLVGSTPGDSAGLYYGISLPNGNYIVVAPAWNDYRGAVTWGSGDVGISGVVSAANSLVGSNIADDVGSGGIYAAGNSNYIVRSPYWNGSLIYSEGAVTWGDGGMGVHGIVSADNSLIGSRPGDQIGSYIRNLPNGNYVIGSPMWQGRGAVTWGDGNLGVRGIVSVDNSLVGTRGSDSVGFGGVVPLTNGNYVVLSDGWNFGAGAVTWGDGRTGITGVVSAENSLVGGAGITDRVGYDGATPLANGNYVVSSSGWNGQRGAATWGNGNTGSSGMVTAANSLVGTDPGDFVAFVTPLSNGNYVVSAPGWNGRRGAVTWGNGTSGVTGTVSAATSLVGTDPNDQVGGLNTITALTNGNYVVRSPNWNGQRGAATWGDGTVGAIGAVSDTNSLVGSAPGDQIASSNAVQLTNGNYVVASPNWNNGRGAATWGNGAIGIHGILSEENSLVGSSASDRVGTSVAALVGNGNYVVASPNWNGGRGAATWADGLIGIRGAISPDTSLIGTDPGDAVSYDGVVRWSNGNFFVESTGWNRGHGALTWGNGMTGVSGAVSLDNSIAGANSGDLSRFLLYSVGNGDAVATSFNRNTTRMTATWINGTTGETVDASHEINAGNTIMARVFNSSSFVQNDPPNQSFVAEFQSSSGGEVVVGMTNPNRFSYARAQAQTVALTPDFITATLNTGTAVVLQASNDITVNDPITVDAGGHGGSLTLQAGRSIVLNATITTDNGPLTLIANDTRADGVVDAERDPGAAFITAAGGTAIDTGTAPLDIELRDGAGLTYSGSRAINLQALAAGSLTVSNTGPSIGSDIRLVSVTTAGPQTYRSPDGITRVSASLSSGSFPITFTDSVVLDGGVSVDAGSSRVDFAGSGLQTLQSDDGATLSALDHDGTGTLQLAGPVTVSGSLLQMAGTFDANDEPVMVGGSAVMVGGTYLAGTAPQSFANGLVVVGGIFTSSTGPMFVSAGVIETGGTFGGEGTVDSLTVYGGTVLPGTSDPGVLTVTGGVTFNLLTTFQVTANGPDPGTGYSQLIAGGPVNLSGATLNLVLGFQPALGTAFEILSTADSSGISGTFAGLPEGAIFLQSGFEFQITYQGGDGGTSVIVTRLA